MEFKDLSKMMSFLFPAYPVMDKALSLSQYWKGCFQATDDKSQLADREEGQKLYNISIITICGR